MWIGFQGKHWIPVISFVHSICQMYGYWISRRYIRNDVQSRCCSKRDRCMCFIRAPCCWRIFTCAHSQFIFSSYPDVSTGCQPATAAAAAVAARPHPQTVIQPPPTGAAPRREVRSENVSLRSGFFCYLQPRVCFTNVSGTSLGFLWRDKRKTEEVISGSADIPSQRMVLTAAR